MIKSDFIALITIIGFKLDFNGYKIGMNHQSLDISFIDDLRFQLSQTMINGGIVTGKSFGIFDLKTFGDNSDFQMEIFLSFINGAFIKETGKPNLKVIEYIRDNKIQDILK
jgi:hypothetical protein